MSSLVYRYDREYGSEEVRDVAKGSVLSGGGGVSYALGCGVVADSGNEAQFWSVGPHEDQQSGFLACCAVDVLGNVMPPLSLYHNREAEGFLLTEDFDAPDSVAYTMEQYLGLAKLTIEAYRMVCPDHWSNDPVRAKDPLVVLSVQKKVKTTVVYCCPHCGAKTEAKNKHSVATNECHNTECSHTTIPVGDLVRKTTYKNGFHLHGIQRRNELGTRLDAARSAPVLTTNQHLIVRKIIYLLWRGRTETTAASSSSSAASSSSSSATSLSLPPFSPIEQQAIDPNILGSSTSNWNGSLRGDFAPKITQCICANASLQIHECVLCGSSRRRNKKYKIVEQNRAYIPTLVLCADGTVHAAETEFVQNFGGMDITVHNAGSMYSPLQGMAWKGRINDNGAKVDVNIGCVDANGGVQSVVVKDRDVSNNSIITLESLPGGVSAVVGVVDKRFENTLNILRMTCGWVPTPTPLTRFEMPADFQVRVTDIVHVSPNTTKKGKKTKGSCGASVVVSITPSIAGDGGEADSHRVVLSSGLISDIMKVECCSHEPAFPRKVMSSTSNVPYDDDRSKAAKEILLREWGKRYSQHTYLSLRYAKVDVEPKLTSEDKNKGERTTSSLANTAQYRDRTKNMAGKKLVRVIYANIEGHGAGRCWNSYRCKCGLLRKKMEDRPDLAGISVCTKCDPKTDIGVHKSSKQFLLFKIYTNSYGNIETTVQLRCRSTHKGICQSSGTYQFCSISAHCAHYNDGGSTQYGGLIPQFGMGVKNLSHKLGYTELLRRLNPDLYQKMDRQKNLHPSNGIPTGSAAAQQAAIFQNPQAFASQNQRFKPAVAKAGSIVGVKRLVGASASSSRSSSSSGRSNRSSSQAVSQIQPSKQRKLMRGGRKRK